MTWAEACDDLSLNDLPYKIELDVHGRLVMVRRRVIHSRLQGRVARALARAGMGSSMTISCPIQTRAGVLVADVAWGDDAGFASESVDVVVCSTAPEVCIDLSSLIADNDLRQARLEAYFEAGAEEVWFCNDDGKLTFCLSPTQTAKKSLRFPDFPSKV